MFIQYHLNIAQVNIIYFQLAGIDYKNNPELKKLQFLAPGPKMASSLVPKREMNVKEGMRYSMYNM